MKILLFTFKDTIGEKVAKRIKFPVKIFHLNSTVEAIDGFVSNIDVSQYEYILGMGMYSGRDSDALRIEIQCSSHFRNNNDNLQKIPIPYFLHADEGIKFAAGIGTSWCNFVSFKILKTHPKSNYSFIHIPNLFPADKASKIIDQQLIGLVR